MGNAVDLAAYTRRGKGYARNYLSFSFTPIDFEEDITLRNDVFLTCGCAYIRYITKRYSGGFNIICYDRPLFHICHVPIRNYEDFLKKCEEDPAFEFVRKITGLDNRHFEFARRNYGNLIPLNFDFIRYEQLCGGRTRFSTRAIMEMVSKEREAIREMKKSKAKMIYGIKEKDNDH